MPAPVRVHVLQHVPFEGPARIKDWAERAGHTVTSTRLFQQETLPKIDDVDFVVVMGGPMGANDDEKFRWIRGEKQFLEAAITKKKRVLGVCLGAQLLAQVLGAKVYPNREKEIGWYPIEMDQPSARQTPLNVLPQKVNVFHWHGDTFDLPKGAVHLAKSAACENQAFAFNAHVIGLQFHLEVSMTEVENLIRNCPKDITKGNFVMTAEEMLDLAPSHVPPINAALSRFLDGFTTCHV